jgi:protein N-terminal amidase
MKIACLQFSAEMGQVERNMRHADGILAHTNLPSNLDWLILPECAFTGTHIALFNTFLEDQSYLYQIGVL